MISGRRSLKSELTLEMVSLICQFSQLASHLKQIRNQSLNSKATSVETTKRLTVATENHFQSLGMVACREFDVETIYIPRSTDRDPYLRPGRIDLLIESPMGWRIAIEIDRGNKKWSVEKLKHLQSTEPATFGIWIRWGGRLRNVDTSTVTLFDLTSDPAQIIWPLDKVVA